MRGRFTVIKHSPKLSNSLEPAQPGQLCHTATEIYRQVLRRAAAHANLIIEVVVALVHLLQSEAPLILHMDVRVELPLSGLHKLTHTHTYYYLLHLFTRDCF